MAKQLGVIMASHEFKHPVRSALQRYVEVWHEASASGHEFYKFIGEQVRLDGADAVALNAVHFVQLPA